MQFAMNSMIVPGMFGCSSFLISVCNTVYVYCVESFAHIECYSGCSRRGATWMNHLPTTVPLSVYSAVTAECCVLHPCRMGVSGMFAVM